MTLRARWTSCKVTDGLILDPLCVPKGSPIAYPLVNEQGASPVVPRSLRGAEGYGYAGMLVVDSMESGWEDCA